MQGNVQRIGKSCVQTSFLSPEHFSLKGIMQFLSQLEKLLGILHCIRQCVILLLTAGFI